MFECYNLLAPMEWGAAIFWGWITIRKLQDPMVTSLNLHTFTFWEIDSINYVKNYKVWYKKTQGILGVNLCKCQYFKILLFCNLPKTKITIFWISRIFIFKIFKSLVTILCGIQMIMMDNNRIHVFYKYGQQQKLHTAGLVLKWFNIFYIK
jgi:hypothetical protein